MRKDVRKKKRKTSVERSFEQSRGCVKLGTAMLRLDRRYMPIAAAKVY